MDKKSLSERDICNKFITPALQASGWDMDFQFLAEVSLTDGWGVGKPQYQAVLRELERSLYQ